MRRWIPFLLLLGCDREATHEECLELVGAECGETVGCAPIRGRELVPRGDDFCLPVAALTETVGCQGAHIDCNDAITVADAPDGGRWWFSDTCIPEDFTATDLPDAEPCG